MMQKKSYKLSEYQVDLLWEYGKGANGLPVINGLQFIKHI